LAITTVYKEKGIGIGNIIIERIIMIHIIKNGGTIAALLFLLFKGHMSKAQDMDLWYEKPAMRWEEMLLP
jgi:hypothetical protein